MDEFDYVDVEGGIHTGEDLGTPLSRPKKRKLKKDGAALLEEGRNLI